MLLRIIPSIGSTALFLAIVSAWPAPTPPPPPSIVSHMPVVIEAPSPPPVVHVEVQPVKAEPAPPPTIDRLLDDLAGEPCESDPARIGTPLASMPSLDSEDPPVLPSTDLILSDVAAEGCLIAAWGPAGVMVSTDGGRRFHRVLDAGGIVHHVIAYGGRVLAARGDRLGIFDVARRIESWHPLPLASDDGSLRLIAFGGKIGVTNRSLVAFTGDQGETWRIRELPPVDDGDTVHLEEIDGMLAIIRETSVENDAEHDEVATLHVLTSDGVQQSWRRKGRLLSTDGQGMAVMRDDAGHVDLVPAYDPSRRIASLDLDDDDDGEADREIIGAVQGAGRVYLATTDALYLATSGSKRARKVHDDALDHDWTPQAIDGNGYLIALDDEGRVLRWSKRGGWRILLDGQIDEGDCDCC